MIKEPLHACRFCETPLNATLIDLGMSPLSNSFLKKDELQKKEKFYPLHARICNECFLVQLPELQSPENIFKDYAYFSSYSESWLQHCASYTNMIVERFKIDAKWQVVELASNDGYLLQYFAAKKIPVLGIEPADNVAQVARDKGIPTESVFFSKTIAEQMRSSWGKQANLIIANNVLAHVPNLNDFVAGIKVLLAPKGIVTLEFPHLLRLLQENQFDTIYHEHFSYFSLLTAEKVFSQNQLCIFDVEELTVHGGSLRLYVKHCEDEEQTVQPRVAALLALEKKVGLDNIKSYDVFSANVTRLKTQLLTFMNQVKAAGKTIAGYGAPAKGNTLLNYCEISAQLLSFTVDKNPHKQGMYLPGTHIPILHPDEIKKAKPDYLLILPWNLKQEIIKQTDYIREWNGKFVIPIPELQVL
ncbi:MAG: class I SAM-dependent methyltransferase [Gammaproteobacteria bacterium]|nr:class I SAM-dependent methyltransferase [Gammaproteobacteria bacterium]